MNKFTSQRKQALRKILDGKIRWIQKTSFVAAIALSLSLVEIANGQVWQNPSGGSFNNPANWDTFVVPGEAENAEFSLSGGYNVSFNTDVTNRTATVSDGNVNFRTTLGQPIRTYALTQGLFVDDVGSLTIGGATESSRLNIETLQIVVNGGGEVNIRSGSLIDTDAVSVGTGAMYITDQSNLMMENGFGFIAPSAGNVATVVVSGTGSSWNVELTQVAYRGDGSFVVTGGATATTDFSSVGINSSGVGVVQVVGAGSEFDVAETFSIGGSGIGTLNIRNGGLVTSGNAIVSEFSGSGTATVFGANSVWDVDNILTVGQRLGGLGTLNIEAGARVESEFGNIGSESEGNGTVLVTGAGSTWDVVDEIYVGLAGTGEMMVENGAVVSDVSGFIGHESGSVGAATVRGAGSMWNNSNGLVVGRTGRGILNIETGGVVNALDTTVGQLEGSSGSINLEGTGSELNSSGALIVGDVDRGSISIREGGAVSAQSVRVGDAIDMNSSISIVGDGSILRVAESLEIGGSGRGFVSLASSGQVSADTIRVGVPSSGSGTLSLVVDSRVEAADLLRIGNQGRLFLFSGTVAAGQRTILDETGLIQIDGGRLEFGSMDFEEYQQIEANAGSMAGDIDLVGFTDAGSGSVPSPEFAFFDVQLNNAGTIIGSGFMNGSLNNLSTGQIQSLSSDQIRFAGNGVNSGEVNNFGGFVGFQGSFNNASDGLVAGRGVFSAEQGWSNQGVFAFSSGNADLLGDVELLGAGRLVTSGGGTTTIYDDLIHNGMEVRTSSGAQTVIFGDASGAGSYTGTGTVFFEGDLRPGNSPDIITFDGDVVFGETSGLLIELGGVDFGDFDQLLIDGDLELDATLGVDLLDDFMVSHGQEFLIVDVNGQLFGQFDGLDEGAFVGSFGADLFITYQAGNGNDIALFSAVPEPNTILLLAGMSIAGCMVRRRNSV